MLSVLSHYMERRFTAVLLTALLAFILVFIVVDLVENVDRFIDRKTPIQDVVRYYLFYIPYIVILTLPVAMLIAVLFSVGNLARYNELTAMKASGLSLYRILFPVLRLAFLISLMAMIFGETIVPETNARYLDIKRGTRQPSPAQRDNIFLQDRNEKVIFVHHYDAEQRTGQEISIQQYQGNTLRRRIDAESMIWTDEGWILQNATVREFSGDQENITRFQTLNSPFLTLLPQDFARPKRNPEEMGYFELSDYIRRIQRAGGDARRWLVDLQLKISFPFANFIIVLFGAPLASTRKRTGKALSFGLSLFICFIYYSGVKAGQVLGREELLPPLLAAWVPNLLFMVLGVLLFAKAHK